MTPATLADLAAACSERRIALCISFDPEPGWVAPWMADLNLPGRPLRVSAATADDLAHDALAALAAAEEDGDA